MRRRSRAGGKLATARGGKAETPKRRNATNSVRDRGSGTASEIELEKFIHERDEAQEQQAATADVLKVISRSTFDLQTFFKTIIANAVRLCHAHMGAVHLFDGKLVDIVAFHNFPPEAVKVLQSMYPRPPQSDQASGRAILTGKVSEIEDMLADPKYTRQVTVAGQWGSILAVPMLRDAAPIGAIVITRNEVGRFADRHIELLKTFADQAGIAIENTRLLNELRQRTDDLSEALEQQKATSGVLEVISSSPTDVQPVFDTIVRSAVSLCNGVYSSVVRFDGELMHLVAHHNYTPEVVRALRQMYPMRPDRTQMVGRAILTRATAHVEDALTDAEYAHHLARAAGWRSMLAVPMLREEKPVGAICVMRGEPGLFSETHIKLFRTFADQAVIAIENVRLFEAEQERTRELTESLEQQTATSEVLRVISGSPGDLQPVFDAMLANATRLCEAKFGTLQLRESDSTFRVAAMHNPPPVYAEARRRNPLIYPSAHSALGRVIATKQLVHIADYTQDVAYKQRDPLAVSIVELAGARTLIIIPMLKEGELIGNLLLYRQEVWPFTEKQIALLTNFAAQAVIAIENTRLLNELRQSLQQQTATADVLKVISRSTFDLQTVLDTLVKSATEL